MARQARGTERGRVRRLANPGGEVIVERLEAFDNRARSYTYSILEAPFPVTGYRSTLQVREIENGRASQVDSSDEFTPNGASDDETSLLFAGIYRGGLQALAASFADKGNARS